jgi:hypothetical protein
LIEEAQGMIRAWPEDMGFEAFADGRKPFPDRFAPDFLEQMT